MRYLKAVARREVFAMIEDDTSDVYIDEIILDKLFHDPDWSNDYECLEISKEEFYDSMKGSDEGL